MKTDFSGLDRLQAKLNEIRKADARPLMVSWMKIIEDDNRKGILAGLDKDGNPMDPVKYRPRTPKKLTKAQRNDQRAGIKRGIFAGIGSHPAGLNNNLTPGEYRQLAGPPLAPRRQFSRVITNLKTWFYPNGPGANTAEGYWDQVVNTKGVSFLGFHFRGKGRLPRRDIHGVRPEGREKARKAAVNWMLDVIRTYGANRWFRPAA